jgi:hypothetical protein
MRRERNKRKRRRRQRRRGHIFISMSHQADSTFETGVVAALYL